MAVDAAVIQTDGDQGGGLLSNWRVLAIGGGIALAVVVVMVQRRAGASSDNGQAAGTLGTSANIALGQIAFDQQRISGEQSERDAKLLDAVSGGVASILSGAQANQGALLGQLNLLSQQGMAGQSELKDLLGQLSQQQGAGFNQVWGGILGLSNQASNLSAQQQSLIRSLSWQILASYNPAAANEWYQKYVADPWGTGGTTQTVGTSSSSAAAAASGQGQTSASGGAATVVAGVTGG